jgi:alkylation response protein AidB-like acyl-CoA dehydrogenase
VQRSFDSPASTTSDVEALITRYFSEGAADVDRGIRDVRDGLRLLGEHDLLGLGTDPDRSGELARAIALIERIAGHCLSSAFSLWAHRMVIEYLSRARLDADAELLAELRSGRAIGSTAMAPALRDVAGIEPVPVVARRCREGVRLDGPITWTSNLFPGAVVVLPVRFEDGDDRAVVRIRTTDPGVHVAPSPELLALNATASSSVRLDDVHVSQDAILADDLRGFVGVMKPSLLLSQTAMCVGLAGRSIVEAHSGATGLNAALAGQVDAIAARHQSISDRLHRFAAAPRDVPATDLLEVRLDAVDAAVDATRAELAARGGAAYLAHGDTSRRLREAAFLPVQAPTEGQLRWELSRSA